MKWREEKNQYKFKIWLIEAKWKNKSDIELQGSGFDANFSIYFGLCNAKCSHQKKVKIKIILCMFWRLCDSFWIICAKKWFQWS